MSKGRTRRSTVQRAALDELSEIAREGRTPLSRAELVDGRAESFEVEVELRTEDLERVVGGLDLAEREIFRLRIPLVFPWRPPLVSVEHDRFVGFAHVLQGSRICVFLDEDQEWSPGIGIVGFLDELYRWLGDAAAGRFDPSTALFHPVGGVDHRTPGCPTIVVRPSVRFDAGPIQLLGLRTRSEQRLDLVDEGAAGAVPIVAVHVPAPLSYGAGQTVGGLLGAVHMLQFPPVQGLLTALGAAASRVDRGTPVYFLLAVAPARDRPDLARHLVAGRLPAEVADALRDALPEREPIKLSNPALEVPIEWCDVSEERVEVTNRRDSRRPTRHLVGIHAVVWGCGGIGSWIAEFLTRAGVARLSVCDRPTPIHGGLLVRQDFVELDVGRPKAEAVLSRALAIRDDLEVQVLDEALGIDVSTRSLPECELLVDATVSRSVADLTELMWASSSPSITVARVFVDRPSSSLGLATIARPTGPSLAAIERRAEEEVRASGTLEPFRVFWDPPSSSDEILAEPGCSVPTFHGSAADLAAMGGVLVTLIAPHLETEAAGCHLVSLPHAQAGVPKHHWIAG